MAGLGWLRTGTIAATSGSRNVGGTDTIWGGGVVNQGDIILLPNGTLGEVESVGSNTALTLKQAYTGATASAQPYAIIRMLPSGNVAADLAAALQALIQRYGITLDQLMEWLDSAGAVSFTDGTTTLAGLHGLRKLMADVAAAFPKTGGTVTGPLAVQGNVGIGTGSPNGTLELRRDDMNGPSLVLNNRYSSSGVHKFGSILFGAGRDVSDPSFPGGIWAEGVDPLGNRADLVFGAQLDASAGHPTERFRIRGGGGVSTSEPFAAGQYVLSTMPAPAAFPGYVITVANAAGGAALCLSNGSAWINVRTNAPVN